MSARTLEFLVEGQDSWSLAPADRPVHPRAGLLLNWAQWLEARDKWPPGTSVGVSFPHDGNVKELLADLPRIDLIALNFPKWTDGRAYSQARLLRVRHRYTGQLRATGQVIADMSAQLYRTGFDAIALREGESIEVATRMLNRFPTFYQADAHQPLVRFARGAGPTSAP